MLSSQVRSKELKKVTSRDFSGSATGAQSIGKEPNKKSRRINPTAFPSAKPNYKLN